jgi:hypothetical protein
MNDVLKDTVSGFRGQVLAISRYSTGCTHYGLAPLKVKDGLVQDYQWFDESRVILVKAAIKKTKIPTGGPDKNPRIY